MRFYDFIVPGRCVSIPFFRAGRGWPGRRWRDFMRPKEASCLACEFWELILSRHEEGFQDEGLCRRNAPMPISSERIGGDGTAQDGTEGWFVAWPRTFAQSDWCGQYVPKTYFGGRRCPDEK